MDQSTRRTRRAAAARVLIALADEGCLADPEQWDWEILDRLPLWCLLDATRRRSLQLVAGGLLLAPELRLWIDRRRLAYLREVLGVVCVERLLSRADSFARELAPDRVGKLPPDALAAVSSDADREPTDIDVVSLPFDADRDAVEHYLASAGASVLRATLHPSLPLDALDAALGESAGELPDAIGALLLEQAEMLLDEVGSEQVAA